MAFEYIILYIRNNFTFDLGQKIELYLFENYLFKFINCQFDFENQKPFLKIL